METVPCYQCDKPAIKELVFRALWRNALNLDIYAWREEESTILSIEDIGEALTAHFHSPQSMEDLQHMLQGSHYRFTDAGKTTLAVLVGACEDHSHTLDKAQQWIEKINKPFFLIESSSYVS